MERLICKKEIELAGNPYWVYLKEVPVRIEPGGKATKTAVRAFVKRQQPCSLLG